MDFLSSKKINQNNLIHLHDKEIEVWQPNGQGNESIDVVKPDCNGKIDFLAFNEAFVRNPIYIDSGAGKTAAIMSATCQMNAFNVELPSIGRIYYAHKLKILLFFVYNVSSYFLRIAIEKL